MELIKLAEQDKIIAMYVNDYILGKKTKEETYLAIIVAQANSITEYKSQISSLKFDGRQGGA